MPTLRALFAQRNAMWTIYRDLEAELDIPDGPAHPAVVEAKRNYFAVTYELSLKDAPLREAIETYLAVPTLSGFEKMAHLINTLIAEEA